MNTKIKNRKTPHSITSNLYGGKSTDTVWVWAFENGDKNSKTIKQHVPKAQVFVAPNTQDLPDNQFKRTDMRNYHVDVWSEKSKNLDRYGKFMTNYEISEWLESASLDTFLESK